MSKILSANISSAIFLATLLVLGTIATILPSSAQAAPYDKDRYNSEYQSYNNNNYYKSKDSSSSSVNVKKIKCNNINTNLNGLESNTNLNDHIGVGTTAFQGNEEVSTNAFGNSERNNDYKNNGKFDLHCINNNDNAGQGPRGPEGPPGEPGPSQILPTNIYQVAGEVDFAENQETATSIAICDQGDVVLSGSYVLQNPFETAFVIDGVLLTPDRWYATAQAVADGSIFIQSLATCFDNPPLRP